MKYTDEKLGLVSISFWYSKYKRDACLRDETFCIIEIGEERYVAMVNKHYKDQPNRLVARKIAFDRAWECLRKNNYKITKEDRTRIWNKLMESGIRLF